MGEFCLAVAVGKETEMTDALEAVGQYVQKEAADELEGGERHARDARFIPVILPGEDDMIVYVDKPVIGDRHSMRIAAEITQNLFGPGKGSLAVNHPVEPVKRRKVGGEGVGVGEIDKIGEKVQEPRAISSEKLLQEHASENAGENAFRQEVPGLAGDPPRSVGGEPAAWHDTVHVGMVRERLAPGMQNRGQPDLGAEMFGVAGNGFERLDRCLEQNAID